MLQLLQVVPGLDRDSNYVGVVRLLGGGLAGITAASVTYPLDVVRTRLATQVMLLFFCCMATLPAYQFIILFCSIDTFFCIVFLL